MADSKIDFSFENLHFSCEGDKVWVEKQLNNVLSRIPALLSVHKKGENIMEEVIDIREEDVDEVTNNVAGPAASVKERKAKKSPGVKKAYSSRTTSQKGEKSGVARGRNLDTNVRDNDAAPEVAVGKKSRKSGVAASKKDAETGEVKIGKARVTKAKAVRGRRAVKSKKAAVKAKAARQTTGKTGVAAEQIDSPLLRFLQEKKVDKNQVRKFLATAVFLANSNNVTRLSTPMISKALKSYGIPKLQNASDCLNKNEKKGYCTKEGKEFIITEPGYQFFA